MVDSIIKELEFQKSYLNGETVDTIYFGGGTPSLLTAQELSMILRSIHRFQTVTTAAEITLEANPDDLQRERLDELAAIGVNRLSIGIQSFDDDILRYFNRAHSSDDALNCVKEARLAGFHNISLDLIYGTPGLTEAGWFRNIRSALALEPEHVSAYALTIEEKTVFGRRASKGQLAAPPEEVVAGQFEILMSEMATAGFDHYEISNFGKPGFHSRHNSSYWEQKPYLGIGPSAHSYNGRSRQYNVANNSSYIKSLQEGKVPFELEELSQSNMINEFIMTSLRTSGGLDLRYLKDKFGYDLSQVHRAYLRDLIRLEKIQDRPDVLVLTNKGKLLADKISADLFVSTE